MACCTLLLALLGPITAAHGIEYETTRVFGPEHAGGKYKHPASFDQLANGDLYLVFYGGSAEYGDDTAVYGARRKKDQASWSEPRIIADTPGRSEGNAVVWQASNGDVWLFYVTRYGATWSTSRIKAKISRDGAKSWSDSIIVAFQQGMMVRGHPVTLADGGYLLPVYHETGHDTEQVGADSTSLFLRYDAGKNTWTETNRISAPMGCIQPAVAKITDDYLVCYNRRGGDYSPNTEGYIVRSESRDGGQTWSRGVETEFPNPNAAIDFIRLRNGHLLLLYNDSFTGRTPLTVAISTDNDKSYPIRANIVEGPGSYAYPSAIEAHDGKVHVVYTTAGRTTIMHTVFDEADILKDAGQ